MELSILIRHQMRDVVSIDPGHRGASLDRQGWWVEGEVGDLYDRVVGQRPAAACNQAQSENCYKTCQGQQQSANPACSGRARGKRVLNAIWSCRLPPLLIEMRSARERRVGDGEQLVAGAHLDACNSEQRAEPARPAPSSVRANPQSRERAAGSLSIARYGKSCCLRPSARSGECARSAPLLSRTASAE